MNIGGVIMMMMMVILLFTIIMFMIIINTAQISIRHQYIIKKKTFGANQC